jgi:hypothetical protein
VFFALCLLGLSCDPQSRSFEVEYRVSGSASSAHLAYYNAAGVREEHDYVPLPWSAQFTLPKGHYVSLFSQNTGETGTVKCAILVDGVERVVFETDTPYGVANCFLGNVPP